MRGDDIQAFPVVFSENIEMRDVECGMTLRDWFAGQALTCGLRTCGMTRVGCRRRAKKAYWMADALLEARK